MVPQSAKVVRRGHFTCCEGGQPSSQYRLVKPRFHPPRVLAGEFLLTER